MKKNKRMEAIRETFPAPEPWQRREKYIVVVDIDGTIAKPDPEKIKHLQKDPPDYEAYHNMEFNEEPYPEMIRMLKTLYDAGYDILFCTSRSEAIKEKTLDWIWNQFPDWFACNITMRPIDDHRHDTELKPAIVKEFCDNWGWDMSKIAFILEDRTSMVKKWRELGYMCLQVNQWDG